MNRIIERIPHFIESGRILVVTSISCIAAYFDSTKTFILALMIAFAVNIYAGMLADDVSIKRRKNFKKKKFADSLKELFYITGTTYFIKALMDLMHFNERSVYTVQILICLALYFYVRNSFRNLKKANPESLWIRTVYHLISFQFAKAMPENVNKAIAMAKQEIKEHKENETNK